MAYADQEMSGSRVISIVIVALIHVAVGYLLISGLAISAVKEIAERVTTVDIEEPEPPEPEEEPPPPPPEQEVSPPPPVAPPPPINVSVAPPPIRTQTNIPPPAPPALRIPPPAPVAPPAPPPAPPPPPSQARGATPDGQARWTRRIIENYPSRALRREIEGTVGVSVTVGADGRVSSCRVTRSADPTLDQAACDDLTRYGRFNPALDAAGNPTSGSWATNIVYQIN